MLHKIAGNVRINGNDNYLKSPVVTLLFLVALGFSLWGGGGQLAFAQSVTVNPGDDIKWTWNFVGGKSYRVKLRYWAKTIDGNGTRGAVGGTDYKEINGYMYIDAGNNEFSVQTETYENDDATGTLNFQVELVNPQYQDGNVWVNIDGSHKIQRRFHQQGHIYYESPSIQAP